MSTPDDDRWKTQHVHQQAMIQRRLEAAKIPLRYREARVPEWLDFKEEDSYYLHGLQDSSKTHTMCAMLRTRALGYYGAERQVEFTTVDHLLENLKRGFGGGREDALEAVHVYIEHYETVPVLGIDDLGAERVTDWTLGVLTSIINTRYNELRPTYFTSNLTVEDLAAQFSERIASRIQGWCQVIKMKESGHRARKEE